MGIMMPETCWEIVKNKHLIVASCWFSLSLHTFKPVFVAVLIQFRLCHPSCSWVQALYCCGPCSVPGQSILVLWLDKLALGQGFHRVLWFSTIIIIPYFIDISLTLRSLSSWRLAVLTTCQLSTSFHVDTCSFCAVCFIFVSVAFSVFIRLLKIWLCSFLLMCFGFRGDH